LSDFIQILIRMCSDIFHQHSVLADQIYNADHYMPASWYML